MNAINRQYEDLLARVLEDGQYRSDRTGTGAYSAFGESLTYDLTEGFPLITTKRVHLKSVVGELLWFLSGSTNKNQLRDEYGVTIWDEWTAPDPWFDGDLGPIYGAQWRNTAWATRDGDPIYVDQISNVIKSIKNDPFSRRHIVSAWNPGQIHEMSLPPCHMMFQFFVGSDGDGRPVNLSLHLYQRSADLFLGVPFNIASYALLLEMVAQEVGLEAKHLKLTFGDAHIYRNHVEQIKEQVSRPPYEFPKLILDPVDTVFNHTPETIHVSDYQHHPKITADVAV
ncbi:thymidylate synthase [Brevibacterium phage Cantare]|uniref:Thymidylate synthase n=1 Tax=Brevibacterium phage Cantare TaxID=2338395 RepID=A0A3G3LYR2_9CAUD|nr:thymidylate synthase [Brevibacterium phage Cantare]AYQ99269.1 thymidylate synthase [Brevibacterium phage Cantare]